MKKHLCILLCCLLVLGGCSNQPVNIPTEEGTPSSSSASNSEPQVEQSSSSSEEISSSSQAESSSSSASSSSSSQSSIPPKKPVPAPVQKPAQPPAKQEEKPADPYIEKLKSIVWSGINAGPPQSKFIYPVDKNWSSTVYNYSYDTPGQAHLSWKVSWILEGLDYAYRAIKDTKVLDISVEMYDTLLSVRDDKIGRKAWNGEIYPLWGSTRRYNGCSFTLADSEGNALAKLNFYCQGNDATFVSVSNAGSESFDLNIKYNSTVYELKGLTLQTLEARISEINWAYYGSPLPSKKVVEAVVSNKDSTAVPAAHDYKLVDNTNVPTVVHTALILEPMVNTYIQMKALGHPQTEYYKQQIELMFNTLIKLNWNENGYFSECKDSPTHLGGGYIIPWNQQFPLVSAMAVFAKEENNPTYKAIVEKFYRYFKSKVLSTSTGYLWRYWEDPSGTVTYNETTNYSGIDLSSISAIYKTKLAFTDKDMDMFASTIKNRVMKVPSKPSTRIDGTTPNNANIKLIYKYLPFAYKVPSIITELKKQSMTWDNAARMLYYYK